MLVILPVKIIELPGVVVALLLSICKITAEAANGGRKNAADTIIDIFRGKRFIFMIVYYF